MNTPITIIQMSAALIMILSILLQQRGSGLGNTFGGTGNTYRTKRGIEQILMWITVVTGVLFAFTSFLAVIY
jgi:protein translocase SecG subunit